jgi:hypothetical protein
MKPEGLDKRKSKALLRRMKRAANRSGYHGGQRPFRTHRRWLHARRETVVGESIFLGGDVDLEDNDLAAGAALAAARYPTVSAAYRSRTDTAHRVAFSVPVWGGSGRAEPPLGMLVMSVPLHRFTKHSGLEVGEQMELALIDLGGDTLEEVPATGLILEHPHLGGGDVDRVTETELLARLRRLRQRGVQCARKRLGEQAKARIAAQMQTETIDHQFIDPIVTGEPPAIAAFWPVITVSGSEGSRDVQ